MKPVILLLVLSALQSCSTAKADSVTTLDCKTVLLSSGGGPVQRCESGEAVCFVTEQGGISCLKK